ncbi:MAG: type I-C CRISPR-associated protein Cas8c/Csd1 [Lentisphaerae bacterium]|nr:type I-C CRISPR-associated protein Cas8c/Csd1 [Lentisphaerota bacterium]
MLLKHLYDYAHSRNLLDDLAFEPKAVRWIIDLDSEGHLIGQGPTQTGDDKRGKEFDCPKTKRVKVAGGVSEFLADGVTAVFGLEGDPEKLAKETEKKQVDRRRNNASKQHAFWEQIQAANDADECKDSLSEVVSFGRALKDGEPPPFIRYGTKANDDSRKETKPAWWIRRADGSEVKLGPENFSFRVNDRLLLEDKGIRDWWRKQYVAEVNATKAEAHRGLCIVTGKPDQPIARTHSVKIGGFADSPPGGAALVSFEKSSKAFASYGFHEGLNCPTSEDAATAYCTALKALMQDDNTHLREAGGTVLCFWAKETKMVGSWMSSLLNKPDPQTVADFMKAPWAGVDRELAKKDAFIAVTLKGCAGRMAISHWVQEPLDQAVANFVTWFADLALDVPMRQAPKAAKKAEDRKSEYNPLSIYWLANSTVREAKDLRPETLSQLYRAALERAAPSTVLIKPILAQLRSKLADKDYKLIYDESRFSLLKLILNRNRKESDMEIRPQLTADTDDPAYNCGRLLSVLSETQKKAQGYPKGFTGVAERYFGTASASPGTVLPLLLRLNRHHLDKIRKSGNNAYEETVIRDILSHFKSADRIPPVFPRHLDLQAQGRFALGFYQQQAADAAGRAERKEAKEAEKIAQTETDHQLSLV